MSDSQPRDKQDKSAEPAERKEFTEPKLRFVAPKLSQHGELADVTRGFFGSFSP